LLFILIALLHYQTVLRPYPLCLQCLQFVHRTFDFLLRLLFKCLFPSILLFIVSLACLLSLFLLNLQFSVWFH
jgi:hypothetical protein